MKFAIVAVLALAVTIEGSAISWASHGHPEWSSWGNSYAHHGGWAGHDTHGISLNQGHGGYHNYHYAPAHVAHHDDHHHSAHYVAKTLGAVHTAPLPGHIENVKSLNVAAPADHHGHGYAHGLSHGYDGYYHAPAYAAHHGHGHGHHDAHYVAKTLGAVHTAPLPGHHDDVKSLNVASAPGTH